MNNVHVIVPINLHDTSQPSGGNAYDRRVCMGLARLGFNIWERMVPGTWPEPDEEALAALADVVGTVPDGALLLVDGLIASASGDVLIREASRVRVIVIVHMPLGAQPGQLGAAARAEERAVLSSVSTVITTSNWTRDWLIAEYGLPRRHVYVVEPGVDLADTATGSDDGGSLLCVAAVTPGKGHSDLVAALATITDLPWRLSIVGSLDRSPVNVEMLRRQIVECDLQDRITLHGARTGPHLHHHYRQADLFVLPSHAETYGMVITEALAHELPVVATEVGGIPDALGRTLDGTRPGLLVPPHDPQALALAISTWLTEPTVRRELRSAAGRRRAHLTAWSDTTRRFAKVLEKAVA